MFSGFCASVVGILVAARLSLGIASNGFWELKAVFIISYWALVSLEL
ncbi:hypothetical protein CM15mP35_03510 [bacterium]|nr:MAG: hypothetical protein CM15mP35_03510 [bacterium]